MDHNRAILTVIYVAAKRTDYKLVAVCGHSLHDWSGRSIYHVTHTPQARECLRMRMLIELRKHTLRKRNIVHLQSARGILDLMTKNSSRKLSNKHVSARS